MLIYVRILLIQKGQKLLEFMASQTPTDMSQKITKSVEPPKIASPQPSPQPSPRQNNNNQTTQNQNTQPLSSPRNQINNFTLGQNRVVQKPAVTNNSPNISTSPTSPPPAATRTISSPAITRPNASPNPSPSPSVPQLNRNISTNQIQSPISPSLANRGPPPVNNFVAKIPAKPASNNDNQTSPRAKGLGVKPESPRNSLNLILGNRNPNMIFILDNAITQIDETVKERFASALSRIGFSLKFNKYANDTKEQKEYLDIFRPEDLPLTAFLKAILICLKATHLVTYS